MTSDMSEILRISAVALIGVFASAVLSRGESGLSFAVKLAVGITVFGAVALLMGERLLWIGEFFEGTLGESGGRYVSVMVKSLGIAYVSGISGSICKDLGENVAANGVETAGKLAIVSVGLPLISELFGYVESMLSEV